MVCVRCACVFGVCMRVCARLVRVRVLVCVGVRWCVLVCVGVFCVPVCLCVVVCVRVFWSCVVVRRCALVFDCLGSCGFACDCVRLRVFVCLYVFVCVSLRVCG